MSRSRFEAHIPRSTRRQFVAGTLEVTAGFMAACSLLPDATPFTQYQLEGYTVKVPSDYKHSPLRLPNDQYEHQFNGEATNGIPTYISIKNFPANGSFENYIREFQRGVTRLSNDSAYKDTLVRTSRIRFKGKEAFRVEIDKIPADDKSKGVYSTRSIGFAANNRFWELMFTAHSSVMGEKQKVFEKVLETFTLNVDVN